MDHYLDRWRPSGVSYPGIVSHFSPEKSTRDYWNTVSLPFSIGHAKLLAAGAIPGDIATRQAPRPLPIFQVDQVEADTDDLRWFVRIVPFGTPPSPSFSAAEKFSPGSEDNYFPEIMYSMQDSEDRGVRWIKSNLVPLFDRNREWAENVSQEAVEKTETALDKKYAEEGTGIILRFFKAGLPILIIDILFVLPAQVYGLVFSMIGTWILLVETDFEDRHSIAAQAERELGAGLRSSVDESITKRLAHQSVMANIGLVWMTLGFSLQIITLVIFPDGNAINMDLWPNLLQQK